jgi:hypothetical protein
VRQQAAEEHPESQPMTFEKFEDDDKGFIAWRDENEDGFILNLPRPSARSPRKYYLAAVKLHSAKCSTLKSNKHGEKAWTENDYIKVCAPSEQDLVKWFDQNADKPAGWKPPRCHYCAND